MDIFLAILAIVCGVIGIVGAVLPILPGTLISYVGLLCTYFTSQSDLPSGKLWLWGILSGIVIVLDYILPGYFSKLFGGTKAGMIGATAGVVVGMIVSFFVSPISIIIGPILGAIIGEAIYDPRKDIDKIIAVGVGSLISFVVGSGIKLVAGVFMMYYIWTDAFHIIQEAW